MHPPVLHITGARPNFPKAAPVIAALGAAGVPQMLVHTGQHYDDRLSDVFFRELDLPRPDVNLGVGSGSHAQQTAAIMSAAEPLFEEHAPSLVVVYGDVNSTVAAALVAVKMGIPVAHVEAGLRSFDMTMPEEINRRLTDQLSDLLFVTSVDGIAHLANEGVDPGRAHFVGNPMIDTLLAHLDRFDVQRIRGELGLPDRYAVATLHRPSNVDSADDVAHLVKAVHQVADQLPILIPLHPRGRVALTDAGLLEHGDVRVLDPLGYVDFLSAVRGAAAVVTDSGGVQEETTVLGVPCLTLRANTERPVTITHGTNRLVTRATLADAVAEVLGGGGAPRDPDGPPLWDGKSGQRIARIVARWLEERH